MGRSINGGNWSARRYVTSTRLLRCPLLSDSLTQLRTSPLTQTQLTKHLAHKPLSCSQATGCFRSSTPKLQCPGIFAIVTRDLAMMDHPINFHKAVIPAVVLQPRRLPLISNLAFHLSFRQVRALFRQTLLMQAINSHNLDSHIMRRPERRLGLDRSLSSRTRI